eukprot:EG_transcript_16200
MASPWWFSTLLPATASMVLMLAVTSLAFLEANSTTAQQWARPAPYAAATTVNAMPVALGSAVRSSDLSLWNQGHIRLNAMSNLANTNRTTREAQVGSVLSVALLSVVLLATSALLVHLFRLPLERLRAVHQEMGPAPGSHFAMLAVEVSDPSAPTQGPGEAGWQRCQEYLTAALGLTPEEADRCLQSSFGWTAKSRAFWGDRRDVTPTLEGLKEAVAHLQTSVGFSPADLATVCRGFPEALGLKPEEVDYALDHMRQELSLQGDVLRQALLRKPARLGKNLWCAAEGTGACLGRCRRCWSTM